MLSVFRRTITNGARNPITSKSCWSCSVSQTCPYRASSVSRVPGSLLSCWASSRRVASVWSIMFLFLVLSNPVQYFPVHFVCHPPVNANGTPPCRGKHRSYKAQSTYRKDHRTRCDTWASVRATPHNRSGEDTPVLEWGRTDTLHSALSRSLPVLTRKVACKRKSPRQSKSVAKWCRLLVHWSSTGCSLSLFQSKGGFQHLDHGFGISGSDPCVPWGKQFFPRKFVTRNTSAGFGQGTRGTD